jgi:hypothetical protein
LTFRHSFLNKERQNLFLYANGELEELTPAEEQDSKAVVVGEDNSPADMIDEATGDSNSPEILESSTAEENLTVEEIEPTEEGENGSVSRDIE